MALVFMESFDHLVTADVLEKWTTSGVTGTGASVGINASSGRRSSGGWRWVTGTSTATGSGYVLRVLAPSGATAILGFAFRASGGAGAAGAKIAILRDGATDQVYLRLNSDLTISVVAATVLGISSAALTADVYTYVELKVLIANAGGTVDLRFNGVSVLGGGLSGLDTQASAAAQWTSLILGQGDTPTNSLSGTSRNWDWDDLYICDGTGAAPWNTFLNDCRVDVCYPTAEGASSAWTPSTGSDNALTIDETAPNDDTDYNSTSTVGATDTFVTQDVPVAGAAIYGVQHCLHMKKLDAGPCTVAPVIRVSGVDYPGANLAPGSGYAYGLQIAAVNPATAGEWFDTDFNAAEFGYTRTA